MMKDAAPQPLIDMETLERVVPIIRNAAHPIRLRILDFLQQQDRPCTVTQITEATQATQAIVSQQLRILKDQGIVSARREGNFMFYDIADRSVLLLLNCIHIHQARLLGKAADFQPESLALCAERRP